MGNPILFSKQSGKINPIKIQRYNRVGRKRRSKKLDYVYHKEKSGKSQFPYSEKARHLTTAIRADGAISAGTAGVVTLAMGKAFIKVCQMVKLGKLSEAEITSSKGAAVMKTEFKKQIQKKKD